MLVQPEMLQAANISAFVSWLFANNSVRSREDEERQEGWQNSKIVPGELLLGYLTIILPLQHLWGAQHVILNCETRYSHSASFGG